MRIALVSPYDWAVPGGVNSHVTNLGHQLMRRGHEVMIIAPASKQTGREPPYVRIIGHSSIGLPASGSVANVSISFNLGSRVKHLLQRETFDVVHLHEPFMPLLPFQFMRFSQTTNVVTFHAASEGGKRLYAYSKHIIEPWMHNVHGRIAHSYSALRLIGRHLAGRYRIIPSGVDCAQFAEALPFPEYLDGKRNILFLGRLEKRKGLPFLLEAYAKIKAEMPETRLIVVGGDGGLRAVCERYVAQNRLADVVFVGYVSDEDKARYFKTADVYCAPNTGAESLGIVLLEAMAAGTPLVASWIEGFADLIKEEQEGLLAPPRDSEALAGALRRMLSDDGMREEMGKAASRTAQAFSWERMSGQVLEFYEETVAGRGNGGLG
ncbi:MAG TPA: glycosyltransferase family 4 protein [Dehalococcoidia bacterium]|nr:glycosyltransferase family 4 protein [Dehalococcoidia bacterium]